MEKPAALYLHFVKDEKQYSWENAFVSSLTAILQQLTGEDITIFSNCSVEKTTLVNPVKDKTFALCLLIFNYSANTELEEAEYSSFRKLCEELNLLFEDRVYLVHRYYKRKYELSDKLECYHAFNLFEINTKTHEVTNFQLDGGHEKNARFWMKMTDLSYAIKSMIDLQISPLAIPREKTIYLGEVSQDQIKNHDQLRRDLQLSGFRVLPEKPLPRETGEFAKSVKTLLSESILSINVMGELYGDCPTGSDYSYQELQNRYFTEVYNLQKKEGVIPPVMRIIWSPPLLEPYEEKQVQYLKRLNKEINSTDGTELVQSTRYELVQLMEQNIRKGQLKKSERDDVPEKLLLIADNYRKDTVLQSIKILNEKHITYTSLQTVTGNQEYDLHQMMQQIGNYSHCLIFHFEPNNMWINSILSILSRSAGYVNSMPERYAGIFLKDVPEKILDFFPLVVEPYIINSVNLGQQIDTFISKINA